MVSTLNCQEIFTCTWPLQPARSQAASTPSGPARRGPTRPRPRSPRVSQEERRLRNLLPPPVPPPQPPQPPPPPPASPPRRFHHVLGEPRLGVAPWNSFPGRPTRLASWDAGRPTDVSPPTASTTRREPGEKTWTSGR